MAHRHGSTQHTAGLRPVTTVSLLAATGIFTGLAVAIVTLHLGFRPVLTASMRPTYGPGALLVTREVPVDDVRPGMIVVFTPPGEHSQFAHRVTSVTGPPSDPIVTTKGDANRSPDPWHAQLMSATVPQVVASVPFVGRLMVGVRGPIRLVLVVLGGLLVLYAGLRSILAPTGRRSVATA